jgi:hypothetical protein
VKTYRIYKAVWGVNTLKALIFTGLRRGGENRNPRKKPEAVRTSELASKRVDDRN